MLYRTIQDPDRAVMLDPVVTSLNSTKSPTETTQVNPLPLHVVAFVAVHVGPFAQGLVTSKKVIASDFEDPCAALNWQLIFVSVMATSLYICGTA